MNHIDVRELNFEHVRRGKGRIHLAVPTPQDAAVETLCGKTFDPGGYEVTEAGADCSACLRRQKDPGAVSSAFFAQGGGSQLLELALAEAARREKRPARHAASRPERQPARERAPAPVPDVVGELKTAGLTPAEGGVWRSPDGAIIRMSGERLAELLAEGKLRLTRKGSRLSVEAGDVRLEIEAGSIVVRVR